MAGSIAIVASRGKKVAFRKGVVRRPLTKFKRVFRATKSLSTRSADPFPAHKMYNLRYTQNFQLATGAVGLYGLQQAFNINSLFDPDSTGVGHQPYGYDALQLAYNKYKVIGATIELTYTDPSADGVLAQTLLTNAQNTTVNLSGQTPDVFLEKQFVTRKFMNNSGSQVSKKTIKVSMAAVSGLTKLQFDADPDRYTGLVTSNPLSQIQFKIAIANTRQTVDVITMQVFMKITYHAMLYERKVMAQS